MRDFCARCLDPLVGPAGFDFIADLGAEMPMRSIGMLLGIPEEDQPAMRDRDRRGPAHRAGQPMRPEQEHVARRRHFADYIDWRAEHPSDDLMTELMKAEFEDETARAARSRGRRS